MAVSAELYESICAVIDMVKLDEVSKDTDAYASGIVAAIELDQITS